MVKGETQGMEAEDLTDLLDFYRDKLNEINIKSLALEKQLEVYNERKSKFTLEYNKLISGKAKTFSELLVTIRSTRSAKANFSIEYFSPDAGWNPLYDIRNNGTTEQLEITSHATMWQKTGFNWKNVDITLSTLDPQFNINAPSIYPQSLELGVNYNYQSNQNNSYQQYKQQWVRLDSVVSNNNRNNNNAANNWGVTEVTKSSNDNGPGTEHKIATPYSIPSNAKRHSYRNKSQACIGHV